MKVEEDDGNKTDFYFSENGRGYTGVKIITSIIKESFRKLQMVRSMYAIRSTAATM